MEKIFDFSNEYMKEISATHTLTEIYQQPKTWGKTYSQIKDKKEEIQNFINKVIKCDDYDVILTGAGTSEFVGDSLFPSLNNLLNHKLKACATTDILATPLNYLSKDKPTLLVSIGRSGNSPESVGTVKVADSVCKNIYHLFITCNEDGALYKYSRGKDNCYMIPLAPETNDQGFAMTSSFTNMYLAAYLCFNLDIIDSILSSFSNVVTSGQKFVDTNYSIVPKIINEFPFERVVYLGNGSLKGLAKESALKMLELTSGKVVVMFDTPLGFRHGPKSIINDKTLTVVYVSDDPYTRQYELDLVKEISRERKENKIVVVLSDKDDEFSSLSDYTICFDVKNIPHSLLPLIYVLFAQTLATYRCLFLNITLDNPCPTGEVNRVVQGVTLYSFEKENK